MRWRRRRRADSARARGDTAVRPSGSDLGSATVRAPIAGALDVRRIELRRSSPSAGSRRRSRPASVIEACRTPYSSQLARPRSDVRELVRVLTIRFPCLAPTGSRKRWTSRVRCAPIQSPRLGLHRRVGHVSSRFLATAVRAVRPWRGGVRCGAVDATRWSNSRSSAEVASVNEQVGSPRASARSSRIRGVRASRATRRSS